MEQRSIEPKMTESEPLKLVYAEYAEHFEKSLRMGEYPLAVKLLERERDIPKLAKRPLRDWGYHLEVCQAMAISRRSGEMIALMLEDMWCFEPVIGYGFTGGNKETFENALKYFLDGNTRYPEAAKDWPTARKWAHEFPRFEEAGKYVAIVTAPLMKACFEPDLVLLWINPVQLNQVLMGITVQWGVDGVSCTLASHAGCVHYVVPPMKSKDFWVSNPCQGDIVFAAKEPSHLVFSAPLAKVEELLAGMEHIARYGWGLPTEYILKPETWLPDSYLTIAQMLGMYEESQPGNTISDTK